MAAVSAAGALAGEQALQLATIVKTTQNVLLFRVAPLREAGWRPVGVFAGATVVNLLVGLLLATLLFRGFPAS